MQIFFFLKNVKQIHAQSPMKVSHSKQKKIWWGKIPFIPSHSIYGPLILINKHGKCFKPQSLFFPKTLNTFFFHLNIRISIRNTCLDNYIFRQNKKVCLMTFRDRWFYLIFSIRLYHFLIQIRIYSFSWCKIGFYTWVFISIWKHTNFLSIQDIIFPKSIVISLLFFILRNLL